MNDQTDTLCWICRALPVAAGEQGVCARCDDTWIRPYDLSWEVLSKYLHGHWKEIVARGSFDLSKAFRGEAAAGALNVHLHFVKLLGCRLQADNINVDLASFSAALSKRQPHPEITLLIADCAPDRGKLRYYESDVSVLRRDDEVHSALWMSLAFPVAIKVCYLTRSAPVSEPEGFPWHPNRQRKLVKLSPYKGDTRPTHARRDLRM